MNSRNIRFLLLAAVPLAASQLHANSLIDGSADAGEAKSTTCTACHGASGISVNPQWPNHAGQGAPYMVAQLQAFKAGKRQDPLMSPQAMLLDDEDMRDLAVYFESMPAAVQAVADPATVDRGQSLYRGGAADKNVPACLACHGPTGQGNPAAEYPALQGQHAAYTAKQLRDFASGARVSAGPVQIMGDIASRLSDDDIEAVASYVQGLKP